MVFPLIYAHHCIHKPIQTSSHRGRTNWPGQKRQWACTVISPCTDAIFKISRFGENFLLAYLGPEANIKLFLFCAISSWIDMREKASHPQLVPSIYSRPWDLPNLHAKYKGVREAGAFRGRLPFKDIHYIHKHSTCSDLALRQTGHFTQSTTGKEW